MTPTRVRRAFVRACFTLIFSGAFVAYLLWKVDLDRTTEVLGNARISYFLIAAAIVVGATFPLAWRWQLLLRARGVHDNLRWLTRTCFVAHSAGQVLPTAIGGDAVRIFETSRRHAGHGSTAAGSVVVERVLGGLATLTLALVALVLGAGRYEITAYLWLEFVLLAAAGAVVVLLFSRWMRQPLARLIPVARLFRLDRPLRSAYEGIHAYRNHPRLLAVAGTVTLAVQTVRVAAIWLVALAVGVHLSPRPYYVMGPLLFLVGLVPFTVNGFAVRESFFVSFLGGLGVAPEQALAVGALYLLLSMVLALPGALILVVEALRRARNGRVVNRRGPPLALNAWLRYDGIQRALRKTGEVESVLEIGPGAGAIGARLAHRYEYLAVEPDSVAYGRTRWRLDQIGRGEILCGGVSAIPGKRTFDLVCAFEVLEHLEDDVAAVRAWATHIRDDGWLLLSVPAHQSRFGAHDRIVGHYRRYDRDSLTSLLVGEGFDEPIVLMCGFPFGYALEAARNLIGRLSKPRPTMAEQTAASGTWLQPPDGVAWLTATVSYPFRLIQRPFANTQLGTALVVLARRPPPAPSRANAA